ncbi:putative transposase [Rhodoblastus acidophilus]|uniref:Putative transposase n=1 Tax=Rhodoblastus acidophilus TaxID=1074 RepID=A0A212RH08_RHOAC|nr:Mu transposase C-terminal domain-containing protein [Rhodoblastus acidophilus]PPQ39563.1 hypothetical protein CKO16_04795 [Rhodoblastus acidophilus]RAI24346.1 hypothetical protein CH337_00175 [Rhodoblastus acidophilus]SNB71703.1 putative transposase [Rhodoblastus acidophilus]
MKGKALVSYLPKPPAVQPVPVIREHYGPYDRIGIGIGLKGENAGIYYRCVSSSTIGHSLERLDGTKMVESFTHEDIAEIKKSGGYLYDKDHFAPETATIRLRTGGLYFEDLHRNRQNRAILKQIICDGLQHLIKAKIIGKSDDGIQRGLKLIFETRGSELDKLAMKKCKDREGYHRWIPCSKTVRQWLRNYQDADCNVLGIIDAYRYGPQPSPLDQEVQQILFGMSLKYASTSRLSVADIFRKMKSVIKRINKTRTKQNLPPLGCPDYNTLNARIEANGAFYNFAGREGPDEARKHFALVMGGVTITRIGERWEMDFWEVHIIIWLRHGQLWKYLSPEQKDEIDRGRWRLCLAIDCASQVIVGAHMAPTETAAAAIATLEMGMIDKSAYAVAAGARSTWRFHAGCEKLATDQGSAFLSNNFKDACARLGIKSDNPPAAVPILRGKIERIFRTIDIQAFCRLVGRTFENVTKRNNTEQDLTALTIGQLATILVLYLVDVYHNEGHEGLGGETPANAWNRLERERGVLPAPDMHRRRNACGIRLTRKVNKEGVRVLNNFYNNRILNEYFRQVGDGTEVDVIADRRDLGWISVRLGARGFANIPCITKEMQGVSMVTWIATCKVLRDQFKSQNIPSEEIALDALDRIEEIGEAARLEHSIACPIITPDVVDRHERMVEIPWKSRDAALSNPIAGGDILARAITPSPPGSYTASPIPEPTPPAPRPTPQERIDFDPETGEITPSPSQEDNDDDELPEGWNIED